MTTNHALRGGGGIYTWDGSVVKLLELFRQTPMDWVSVGTIQLTTQVEVSVHFEVLQD